MNMANNFLSIISLGCFNPSILTPDFLSEQKIWSFEESYTGRTTNVITEIKFDDVSLLMEMDRFQALHNKIDPFEKSPIIKIMTKYLDVLKYTPVFTQGINFNVDFIDFKDTKTLRTIFESPKDKLLKLLDRVDEYIFDIRTKLLKEKPEVIIINCKYNIDKNISIAINLRKTEEKIVLNYNFEVGKIKEDKSRLEIIPKNFPSIYKKFINFVEKLEK